MQLVTYSPRLFGYTIHDTRYTMAIDIAFFFLFLTSSLLLWHRLSLKLPELIAIPDQVITERLYEDSARLRLFVLHLKTYYREGTYKRVFWKYIAKILQKTHLSLMRLDNWVVQHSRSLKQNGEVSEKESIPELSSPDYWQKPQKEEVTTTPEISVKSRIEEIRKRD